MTEHARASEDESHKKLFLLQVIQPGLAGLMDGSVSTLAPLFAAAYASHKTWEAFLVGMAASLGAGISMAFAEGLSDDGSLTGRGSPWIRGLVTGAMTTAGGLGHTLPFLIHNFRTAMTVAIYCGGGGIGNDQLRPAQVYGHAVLAGGVSGGSGRSAGVFDGDIDREFVTEVDHRLPQVESTILTKLRYEETISLVQKNSRFRGGWLVGCRRQVKFHLRRGK